MSVSEITVQREITFPKWTAVGEIAAANVIPALFAPKPTEDDSDKGEATTQQGQS